MTVYIGGENAFEPDVFWVRGADSSCQKRDDGYWYGAPDLTVEVLSPSTTTRDHGVKFELYAQHGVREYWIADPVVRCVEVYTNEDGTFKRVGLYTPTDTFGSPVLGVPVAVSALFV